MIAFGCPITDVLQYGEFAEPGIDLVKEPDSEIFSTLSPGSIFRTYNLFLDLAKEHDDLEALVLLHQDAEIVDSDFCAEIREALSDPEVAVIGCGGAVGVRSIAWWEGSVTWASFTHEYKELGGGDIPGLSWRAHDPPSIAATGEVDAIDGFVMVLSPWAVRNLRFDESLGRLHGYDLDFCMQARQAGKKVVTASFRAKHHHSLDLIQDQEAWVAAHMQIAEKWEGQLPEPAGADWKQRARRAEAELEAARIQMRVGGIHNSRLMQAYVELRRSKSWRVTAPLRALGKFARRIRDPRGRREYPDLEEGVPEIPELAPASPAAGPQAPPVDSSADSQAPVEAHPASG